MAHHKANEIAEKGHLFASYPLIFSSVDVLCSASAYETQDVPDFPLILLDSPKRGISLMQGPDVGRL